MSEVDKLKEQVRQEIEKHRSEILTDAEYSQLVEDSKKRSMPQIAIFRASKQSVSSLLVVQGVHRLASLVFFLHVPLILSSSVKLATLTTQLYAGTVGSGVIAMLARMYKQRLAGEFVLRIDFDVETE